MAEAILMREESLRRGQHSDERDQNVERRRVYFFQARERYWCHQLRLDFHWPAALVVLQHRGFVRRSGGALSARAPGRPVERHAQGTRDGSGLFAGTRRNRLELGVLLQLAHPHPGQGAERRSPEVLAELAPDRLAHIL